MKRSNIRPLLRNGLATKHHEIWRDDNNDDVKVTRRDGVTTASIEKNRGFINYSRIPEPYRDPWNEFLTGRKSITALLNMMKFSKRFKQHDAWIAEHHFAKRIQAVQ